MPPRPYLQPDTFPYLAYVLHAFALVKHIVLYCTEKQVWPSRLALWAHHFTMFLLGMS